jgi:hypothetical protein
MTDLVLQQQTFDRLAEKVKRKAKRAERRGQREAVLALVGEVGWTLCCFCRHAEFVGSACDDGYAECHHPVQVVSEDLAQYIDPDSDCWGFRLGSGLAVSDVADILGFMLYRFDSEKTTYRIERDGSIIVQGFEQKAYREAQAQREAEMEAQMVPPTPSNGYGAAHMGFPD